MKNYRERSIMTKTRIFTGKMIAILGGLVITFSARSVSFKDDPYEVFDISKKKYDSAEVRIVTVNDVSDRCQQESHKRHLGGFPYKVYACTFWNDGGVSGRCTIYLGMSTNMHQLGHEIRHCYLWNFHP